MDSETVILQKYAPAWRISVENNNQDEEMTLVLTFDEGDVECSILTVYECNGRDYIVVLPKDKNGNPMEEVYIYRYTEDEEGNPGIEYIEDEDEYEAAADKYDELLDEAEYAELAGDDEDF